MTPIQTATASSVTVVELDRTDADRLLRVLRVCAGISLFFQAIYLLADWDCGGAHYHAIVFLHLLNLLNSLVFFALTYVRAGRAHLPLAVFAGASLVFADTAALSLLTLNREALTITVTIMMVSVAALMPWNWRWQAGLAIAAGASMAGATFIRPEAYAHIRYDWLAIAAAAGAAQYVAWSGQRYRREIASRITALNANHRLLLAEITAREAIAAAKERVHQQLRESEAKLRKIFEASTDLISISRLSDGCYLDLNESFSAATGYSREEALGQTAGDRGLFADRAQLRGFLHLIKSEGKVTNLEADIRTKSGVVHPYLISATVMELGGEPSIVAIGRDITTIKQTEEKLRREIVERTRAMEQRTEAQRELAASEGKLRKIFEVSPDSISIVRMADGEILAVNEKLCAMTGLKREELIGRKAAATGIWIKADLKRFWELLQRDGQARDVDTLLRHRSGRMIPHIITSVVAELSGEWCVISIAHEITDQKEAEAELLAAREAALAASQGEIGIPLQHVARDSHADECDPGHGGIDRRNSAQPRTKKIPRDHAQQRRCAAGADQRHPRSCQDRERPTDPRAGRLRSRKSRRYRLRDIGYSRPSQGSRTAGTVMPDVPLPARRRSAAPSPDPHQSHWQCDQIH